MGQILRRAPGCRLLWNRGQQSQGARGVSTARPPSSSESSPPPRTWELEHLVPIEPVESSSQRSCLHAQGSLVTRRRASEKAGPRPVDTFEVVAEHLASTVPPPPLFVRVGFDPESLCVSSQTNFEFGQHPMSGCPD
eukprot:TRINITY_DN430_c0_g1_i2.p1 TRINITY_DN430_c0_g1~~TRINITY_DN430_c0_g1_i2.p1  ORF type:complete len:137 (-),score=1.27 TRINITY_DN430_c0_g1_i2:1352-1762(-)